MTVSGGQRAVARTHNERLTYLALQPIVLFTKI